MIGLVPLLIVGVVVWIVLSTRGRDGADERGGVRGLRSFLQHSLLLAALFTAAAGVTLVLQTALPAGSIADQRTDDLALGLSLTLVATPAWFLLWRVVARRVRGEVAERSAPGWALYLLLATTVSLIVAYVQVGGVGSMLVGLDPYDPGPIAGAVTWIAVWAAHRRVQADPELSPSGPVTALGALAGSTVGLVGLAVGVGGLLTYALGQVYRLVVGQALVSVGTDEVLLTGLVVSVTALPVWWWHWSRDAIDAPRTTAWHVYVTLVAVFGGLATAVVGAGIVLHTALQWLFGDPVAARAATHFLPIPSALAATTVGVAVWAYHRSILTSEPGARTEPERAYRYLSAAVGLIAASAGVTVGIVAAIEAVTPGVLAVTGPSGPNALVLAATLLLVGGPLWVLSWRHVRTAERDDPSRELEAPSRRAYLFLLLGITGLTAMVSLAVVLFQVLRDLLEGELETAVLYDVRVAIGLLVTAGAVSAYHWTVHRHDRAVAPSGPQAAPHHVLLVSSDGDILARTLAASTGATVRRLHRLDEPTPGTELHPIDVEQLAAAIRADSHPRILVTVDDDGEVHVIPYEPA